MVIVILIVGISLLILIHEFGHFLAARKFGLLVEEFGIGFPPRIFAKKIGETLWSINALPFGGFVRIHGERPELDPEAGKIDQRRSFAHLRIGPRALIIAAGIAMNFLLGWIVVSGVYAVGVPQKVVIQSVVPGSPAENAGFMRGDIVEGFSTTEAFIAYVNEHAGEALLVAVEREGEGLIITATPRSNVPEGEGPLGVALTEFGQERLPIHKSLGAGFMASVGIIWAILQSLGTLIIGIFTGGAVFEDFVGAVGIFEVANESARFGLAHLFQLIGLISLNLVVLNALPIPALDGGRLFFLLIEKLKGSPIAPRKEMAANTIGFLVLILLMVIITIRDVVRIF